MQARKNFPPMFLSNDEEAKYFISHALTLTKNGVRVPNPSDAVAEIQETTVTVIFPPPKVLPDGTNPPLSRAEYHAKLKFDIKPPCFTTNLFVRNFSGNRTPITIAK